MAKDPICQMDVDESAALKAERGGQTYYFCSEHCRSKFLAEDGQRPTHRVVLPQHDRVGCGGEAYRHSRIRRLAGAARQ